MDNTTRQMIADAIAFDDRAKRECEQLEARLEQIKERSVPAEIVYKTFETPRPQAPVQPQASVIPDLDEASMMRWNAWLDERVHKHLDAFDEALDQRLCEILERQVARREEMRKEFNEQLGQLRADIEILRSIASGKTVKIGRNKDVDVA